MSSPKDDLLRAIELTRIAAANIVGYDDSQLIRTDRVGSRCGPLIPLGSSFLSLINVLTIRLD